MLKKSFAYLELLITVSVIALFLVVIVNQTKILTRLSNLDTLNNKNQLHNKDISENPKELRDLKRITDLKKIKRAIGLYLIDSDIIKPNLDGDMVHDLCKDHIWYSIPKSFHNGCPKGKICVYPDSIQQAAQTNGKGWIPINFNIMSSSPSLPTLPLDPMNNPPYYYVYSCNEQKQTFEINTKLESRFYKYTLDEDELDGGNAPGIFEVGNDPGLKLLGQTKNSFFLLSSSKFWQTKASMPTARSGLTASALNGRIYVIGGYNGNGLGYLSLNEEYDPTTDTWQKKAPMPTPRSLLASVALNGKIYVIGGYNSQKIELSENEAYIPSVDAWQKKAPMPTPRDGLGLAVTNGKIYAIGGWDGNRYIAVNEEYDPTKNTWQKKASMPTPRDGLGLAVANGKIYAIGGINNSGYLSTNEMYDPIKNTWQKKAPMPTPRNNLAVAAVGQKIYAIGGWNIENLNNNEEYDPETNTWKKIVTMPTPRVFLSSAVSDDKIYLIGGYNGTSDLVTNEMFDPKGN